MNNAKPNFRLLTDMDDVMENLFECWMDMLRFFQRNNPKYVHKSASEIEEWNVEKAFPMLTTEEVFQPLNTSLIWEMIQPLPGAIRVLKKYNSMERVDVRILTSSHYSSVFPKREFLRKNFPFINWNQVIVASEKQFVDGNVLVDDYENNLVGGRYKGLLFSQPHNRHFDVSMYPYITRVKDWDEAEIVLDKMIEEYFGEEVTKA